MKRVLVAAALASLAAGCLVGPDETRAPPAESSGHLLAGAFTPETTGDEIDEARALARAHGSALELLESNPPQFVVYDLSTEECAALRDALVEKPYVGRIEACTFYLTTDPPNVPDASLGPP